MAFLGIRIPPEVGRLIKQLEVPGEKESPSEYHITILCFDDNWPIKEISKALETTYDVVSKINPFNVVANKVSHFPKRGEDPIPIIAPIESDELHDLHGQLAKAFDSDQIDFKKTFKEFHPHITLAYSKDEHDDFKIDPSIEFMVNEIILWGGDHGDDRIFITFPLRGPKRDKHSCLLQKANIFSKLADNNGPEYLTPTFERRAKERAEMTEERARHILELPDAYSDHELKDAMRKLVKRHHPDQGGHSDKLQEVIQAYRYLNEPKQSVKLEPQSAKLPSQERAPYQGPPWGDWYSKYLGND